MSFLAILASLNPSFAGDGFTVIPSTATVLDRDSLDFFHFFGSSRLRYEFGDLEGLDPSTLGSLRTRFGVETASVGGFKFLAEGEHMWALTDTDHYRAFPGFAPANRTVIADPDNLQLNRLQLSYDLSPLQTTITAGRQSIVRADERFIGSVGWRQNDQTFDAVSLENQSFDDLTFSYAYIDQVNRIFGTNAPISSLEAWDSDSHLLDLAYSGFENDSVRAFAYLLDFDNSPANSVDTYGLELQGTRALGGSSKLKYLLTGALQEDGGANPVDYREYYLRGEIGLSHGIGNIGIGTEVMTSDGAGGRFLFPLGTNHRFNGYADAFLTTPVDGLVDSYAWVGTEAFGWNHTATFHCYNTENNRTELGWEVDYVASRKLCDSADLIFKGAYLDGKGPQEDLTRASVEVNFTF